jgi:hypothetical protein
MKIYGKGILERNTKLSHVECALVHQADALAQKFLLDTRYIASVEASGGAQYSPPATLKENMGSQMQIYL